MNHVPGVTPVAIAETEQAKATQPTVSVWVSASAGSGKTKVLTDRVLALLLSDAKPERILCLTFTKAAAAEMSNRIAERLAAWVTLDDGALARQLERLLGVDPLPETLDRARQLFARVLDSGRGPQILTIHAFCQSVLRRFPVEAGVLPHFTVMDERDSAEALVTAQEETIARAGSGEDAELAEALAQVTTRIHEMRFAELLKSLIAARGKLIKAVEEHGGLGGLIEATRAFLGLKAGDSEATIIRDACADLAFEHARLERAARALARGSDSDAVRSRGIAAWLAAAATRGDTFDDYCAIFLTDKDAPRALRGLATKKALEGDAALAEILTAEADRLATVRERIKAARVFASTRALLRLGAYLLDLYAADKARRGLLDYDDLIERTRELLEQPGRAGWVLYKLDGGIDHVLIDEAQDTNPDQWAIVTALTAEFFAGSGAYGRQDEAPRTVFAVGDRKQSIYGFQGADPAEFQRVQALMEQRVGGAEEEWRDIRLNVSFRSTPAVLKAVDAVFSDIGARDGLGEDEVVHLASREGHAGLVEVWPLVEPAATDDPPRWKPPVERKEADSPPQRLAALIASRIERMVVNKERLESQDRPIRPGDVLVLVRRRTGFVTELVRQLKTRGIAVAGVDRMVLTEQLAVMDLVALGQFLLLPDDDLTLATVLKGPLIGLDDDDLFTLAHERRGGLWEALNAHAGQDTRFGAARGFLAALLARTDYLTPAALYAHVLIACGGRRKILGRLGPDADDPIDEFMNLAYAYQQSHAPSLQGFLHWLAAGDTEIKRDLEQSGADSVRVITAHGSKGLQAPIVFLPDTAQAPKMQDELLWSAGSVLVWAPSVPEQDAATRRLREAAIAAQDREYRRLLYVAMTRAEDRLYVCGWKTRQATRTITWYDMIRAGVTSVPHDIVDEPLLTSVTGNVAVVRLVSSQEAKVVQQDSPAAGAMTHTLPEWAKLAPAPEPTPPAPLAPSTATHIEPAVFSPLTDLGVQRFQRGIVIHRLLQTLPELPRDRRETAATAFVARFAFDADSRAQIVGETLAVLDDPRFAPLFAENSRAEVPLTGLVGNHVVSAQIDRLAVTADEVWIVDYKTNRPPPQDAAHVDPAYLFQMATYRAVIQAIYPGHGVRCVLLWTAGPFLMELAPGALDGALDGALSAD